MAQSQPLDYEAQGVTQAPGRRRRAVAVTLGVVVGILITLPALYIALLPVQFKNWSFACGLFAVPMCVTLYGDGIIKHLMLGMMMIQFPLYGTIIGFASVSRRALTIAISAIVGVHLVAFIICVNSQLW